MQQGSGQFYYENEQKKWFYYENEQKKMILLWEWEKKYGCLTSQFIFILNLSLIQLHFQKNKNLMMLL